MESSSSSDIHAGFARPEEVLVTYARAVDRRDYPRLAACFEDDAEAHYGGTPLLGSRAIVEHISRRTEKYASTVHHTGTVEVHLEDDERASVVSYTVAYLLARRDDAPYLLMRAVEYRDQMVRSDGAWRIRARRHQPLWMVELPASAPSPDGQLDPY